MSDSPEQDPTIEQAEAFEPAYKPPEDEPKTVEQLRDEEVAMRTGVANEMNANNPRSIIDKLTGYNKPSTEVSVAHASALEDNVAFDAEKITHEQEEADAVAEQARVEQERLEKERQAKSDAEKAEMQAALEEHWKQRDELRKRLTKPSKYWAGPGQQEHNNPDFLTESQIDTELKKFDSDWEAEQSQQRQEVAA